MKLVSASATTFTDAVVPLPQKSAASNDDISCCIPNAEQDRPQEFHCEERTVSDSASDSDKSIG